MSLSRYEKLNLGLLFAGGIFLASLSILLRFFVENQQFGIPEWIFALQYSLGFITLAVLLILFWQSNSQLANLTYSVMFTALGLGLLFPPVFMDTAEVLSNIILFVLVLGGGVYHYRFNRPQNTLFIGFLAVLAHEFYLFGIVYCLLAFLELSQPLLLIAIATLTVILYAFRSILADELDKTGDKSKLATVIKAFLSAKDTAALIRNYA